MHGIGGAEKKFAQDLLGIVLPHRDLPSDHFAFVFKFFFRQGREADHITEHVQTGLRAGGRGVDPVDGAVKGGVGIDVTALRLDGLRDLARIATPGPFEEHVLEVVGHARPEPAAFVNAAGATPSL